MRVIGWTVMAGLAALTGGCAHYGGHGLASTTRYQAMDCTAIDAERGRVEAAANALYARARRAGLLGDAAGAGVVAEWPVAIFTRDRGPKDRQRYQQLSMHYEDLRIAARQRQCALSFAPDVSATVRPGATS